jgi:undecaprenyl-diphosphatase
MARRRLAFAHWSISALFALSLSGLLHVLQAGPQPGGLAPDPSVLSSGILLGLAIVIAVRPVPMSLRWPIYSTGVVLVALGGFARLYFALTNLGGILTASLLAVAWVGGIGVAYRTHALAESLSGKAALLAFAGLPIGYALATQIAPRELPETQIPEPVVLTESAWREQGWRDLPGVRFDLRRQSEQPLNLQYAGDLATLGKINAAAGWQASAPLRVADLARLLSPSTPLARLPLLPHVHENARQSAAYVKNVGEERWVVRLWPSGYAIESVGPLWLGTVSAQRKQRRFKLLAFAVTTKSFERPSQALRTDLGNQVIEIAGPTATSPWLLKAPR